jgi:N-methylhydantoinase A
MIGIVVANMVRAIRAVSVERGYDPREFTLVPFGGAGPLHATDVAKSLAIRRCMVPLAPGILCAQGLIVSDLRETFVRTALTPLTPEGAPAIEARVRELAGEAESWFGAEGIPQPDRSLELVIDARYVGQNFELPLSFNYAAALPSIESLRERFFAEHERAYGFYNPLDPVEVVNFRIIAVGRLAKPTDRGTPTTDGAALEASGKRPIWFSDAPEDTRVYDRATLRPRDSVTGPAVIEQLDATTLLFPGDHAVVDAHLNLHVEFAA